MPFATSTDLYGTVQSGTVRVILSPNHKLPKLFLQLTLQRLSSSLADVAASTEPSAMFGTPERAA